MVLYGAGGGGRGVAGAEELGADESRLMKIVSRSRRTAPATESRHSVGGSIGKLITTPVTCGTAGSRR
jgi:hypothetical protein